MLGLDKNFVYKLEYLMHLSTNDQNKNLDFYLGGYDSVFNNGSSDSIHEFMLGKILLDKMYKYKGYHCFYHNLYYYKTTLNLEEYINDVYKILGECVVKTNETLDIDEFIDFKKDAMLRFTKIKKVKNSDNITLRDYKTNLFLVKK